MFTIIIKLCKKAVFNKNNQVLSKFLHKTLEKYDNFQFNTDF